jgi:WD40 repeat protein
MLAKRPEDRYPTPAHLVEALAAVAPAGPMLGRVVAADPPARSGRQPALRIALAAFLLLAAGMSIFWLVFRPGHTTPDHPLSTGDSTSAPRLLGALKTPVRFVAFLADGNRVVASGDDGVIHLWDRSSGQELPVQEPNLGPDDRAMMAGDSRDVLCLWGARKGTATFWDLAAGREKASTAAASNPGALALSADGKRLAAMMANGWVRLYRVTGERPAPLQQEGMLQIRGGLPVLALAPHGRLLAVAGADGKVTVWDAATRREVRTLHEATTGLQSLAFAAGGMLLAAGERDGTVRVWNTADGRQTQVLHGPARPVQALAFSPDSRILASGSADGVALWLMETGRPLGALGAPVAGVQVLAFSPDGRAMVAGGDDHSVWLWEPFR